MKKLTSKKGFTLIEMLVVIAIIAVLVAIIVPTVSSSTTKAKAATDAANLRSAKAEAMILAMDNETLDGEDAIEAGTLGVPSTSKTDNGTFACNIERDEDTNEITKIEVLYGSNGIDYYANIAENGSSD